ncbi:MAG: 16S rRNA (uracil(1498)-N(3))-methyltransferase [Bacteroidetes bacterium]|nr:MAG: 16S rRNA (uracil(1498)-N(3))-methyltransferase [Bacteroidota bacterium]
MKLFYIARPEDETMVLDENESKHLVRVLRLKQGDTIEAVDGEGGWYRGVIADAHVKHCRIGELRLLRREDPIPYHLHLAVAPTKQMDRMEWMLEKATELGVSEITPLLCMHSERKTIKPERLEKILVSAMKQSLRAYKPRLNPLREFRDFLMEPRGGQKWIAHCFPGKRSDISSIPGSASYTFLIGPEGDFSEDELKQAMASCYKPLLLGESRLRTETAAIYVCASMRFRHALG